MNCYITNPHEYSVLPKELTKYNTLFYPEAGMTTIQCFKTSRPLDYHIVTDCPYLVSLYKDEEVFIWRDNKWINPDFQTYGCSYNLITMNLFEYHNTIPQAIVDGETTNCMGFNIK
jgi:hypothetical protein